jgi:hypothetical protein
MKSKLNRKTSLALAFSATVTITVLLGMAKPAHAQWTLGQWNLGANGHYYSVQAITGPNNGWLIARSQAQSLVSPNGTTVDLATITSASEDAFIFAGIDSPTYWSLDITGSNEGPNLGGFQTDKLAEPAGNWAWVTGEPWSYTQWSLGEPNNSVGGTEDFLTLYGASGIRSGNWNDIESTPSPIGTQGSIHYYVAETTSVGVAAPEPTTLALLTLGGFGAFARRRNPNK